MEGPWRKDGRAAERCEFKQVMIAGDKAVGMGRQCRAENRQVAFVRALAWFDRERIDEFSLAGEKTNDLFHLGGRHFELAFQVSFQFVEDVARKHQGVGIQADRDDRITNSPGSEAGQKHVAIKNDPHENALKTSSSVKKPAASAKGMALARKA